MTAPKNIVSKEVSNAVSVESAALFAVGDRVCYVVSSGRVSHISPDGLRYRVEWDEGPWAGQNKGWFSETEIHLANVPALAQSGGEKTPTKESNS